MTNKLHTSQKTQEIFNSLGQSLRLQPFILSKLAIALSVRKGQLQANDFKTDNNGLEQSFSKTKNGTAKISIIICAIWMTTSKGGLYGLSKGQSLFRYLRR